jgi:hypothetical protein
MLGSYNSYHNEETEPLFLSSHDTEERVLSLKSNRKIYFTLLVPIAIFALMAGLAYKGSFSSSTPGRISSIALSAENDLILLDGVKILSKEFIVPTSNLDELYITAMNNYGAFSAPYSFLDEIPGSKIIEPYRDTVVSLGGTYTESATYSYIWKIEGSGKQFFGTSNKIMLTKTGVYDIQIDIYNAHAQYIASFSTKLICK